MSERIFNAAAVGAYVLRMLRVEIPQIDNIYTEIMDRHIPGIGWVYSERSSVCDLLHNCYILNALPCSEDELADMVDEMLGLFWCGSEFIDTLCFFPNNTNLKKRVRYYYRHVPYGIVELHYRPARLWSLGELLVLTSHLAMLKGERWQNIASNVAEQLLSRFLNHDASCVYLRHVNHALHGISCYLMMKRMK